MKWQNCCATKLLSSVCSTPKISKNSECGFVLKVDLKYFTTNTNELSIDRGKGVFGTEQDKVMKTNNPIVDYAEFGFN